MRKTALITLGLLLVVTGLALTILPIPIPLIGVTPFAIGCAILSTQSRLARRWIQRARHRAPPFSVVLERFTTRAPRTLARILRRTRPDAIVRLLKIRRRKSATV
ncbi:MAG TPA: PGPGW domain-containing protein [Rhizomicrobium sp.]